jgi:DNA-binding MarR family transcriptional regulator
LTARGGNLGGDVPARNSCARAEGETVVRVDQTCISAIGGRRAARIVAEWAKRFGVTEAEFQLLWQLRNAPIDGLDQTALANALAFSPSQISGSVERLRSQGRICASSAVADRRRHQWRLSTTGRELIDQVLAAVSLLRNDGDNKTSSSESRSGGREAAA